MSMTNGPELTPDCFAWMAANVLLEGLDAIGGSRELTKDEEDLFEILEELGSRYFGNIVPGVSATGLALSETPIEALWEQASRISREINVLDLLRYRDDVRPRGACRFCGAPGTGAA